jgi:hypothetical protein
MLGLLIAGSVIVVVGLLSIAFGIPVKEFSFGNTLIVSGVIVASTGAILVAASMVIREMKAIAAALGAGGRPVVPWSREHPDPMAAQRTVLAGPASTDSAPPDEAAAAPPPWQAQPEASPAQIGAAEPGPAAETAAPVKKRRNLLFMSSRRDRPQDAAEETGGGEPSLVEAPAPTNVSFEDAWPASERDRSEAPRQPANASRPTEPGARTSPPPIRRPAEAQQVTVLKSGVVDGMAYSLYSDGSIEAQLPEGMIRFASIDELRHHLDQRG